MNSPMPGKRQLLDPTPCGNLITGPAKKNYQHFGAQCGGGVPVGGVVFLPCPPVAPYTLSDLGGCFVVADGVANSVEMGGSGVNLLNEPTRGHTSWDNTFYNGNPPPDVENGTVRDKQPVWELVGSENSRIKTVTPLSGPNESGNSHEGHGHFLARPFQGEIVPVHTMSQPRSPGTECWTLPETSIDENGVELEKTKEMHSHAVNQFNDGAHFHHGGKHWHDLVSDPTASDWRYAGAHEHNFIDASNSNDGGGNHNGWPPDSENIMQQHSHSHTVERTGASDATSGSGAVQLNGGPTDTEVQDHAVDGGDLGHSHGHGTTPSGFGTDEYRSFMTIGTPTGTPPLHTPGDLEFDHRKPGEHYHEDSGGDHNHEHATFYEADPHGTPSSLGDLLEDVAEAQDGGYSASEEGPPAEGGEKTGSHIHSGGNHMHPSLDGMLPTPADGDQPLHEDKHTHGIKEEPHGHLIETPHQHFAVLTSGNHYHWPGDPDIIIRLTPIERIY